MIVVAKYQFDDEECARAFMRALDTHSWGEIASQVYVDGAE